MRLIRLVKCNVLVSGLLLMLLAGCVTRVPQQPGVEPGTPDTATVSPNTVMPNILSPNKVTPKETVRASHQMHSSAQQALADGDLQGAIVFAERGLRIDRRDSGLYLVLAKAYVGMKDFQRAHQFAEQALRFSPPNSSIEQSARYYRDYVKNHL